MAGGTVTNNASGRIVGGTTNTGNTNYGVLATGALTLTNDPSTMVGSVTTRAGQIVGGYTGVEARGVASIVNNGLIASGTLDLANTGTTVTSGYTVGGTDGVRLLAGGTVTNNAGALIQGGTGSGIFTGGAAAVTLVNSGTVTGSQGIYTLGTNNQTFTITNNAGGFVVGTNGVGINNPGTGLTTVTNAGTLSALRESPPTAPSISPTRPDWSRHLVGRDQRNLRRHGNYGIYIGAGGTIRNTGGTIAGAPPMPASMPSAT